MTLVSDLIEEICEEKHIICESLSYGRILKLQKTNKTRFIIGINFDLNTKSVSMILNDKYATYEVLRSFDIPIIEHQILFTSNSRFCDWLGTFEKALWIFHAYHDDVVIKPNKGSEGNGVFHCTDSVTLEKKLFLLLKEHFSVSICPFYRIKTEYRIFYLDGKIEFMYSKVKPVLIWDGLSNVEELLKQFNQHFPNKAIFRENLEINDLNYIPQRGEKYEFSWKFNLSGGAQVNLEVSDFARENIEKIVHKVATCLNVRFVTIDIIQDENDQFFVMEINGNVCLSQFIHLVAEGRNIAKSIYAKAIDTMFND